MAGPDTYLTEQQQQPAGREKPNNIETYLLNASKAIDPSLGSASKARTALQLEALCLQLLRFCNSRDYDNDFMRRHVCPDMLDEYLQGPTLTGFHAHVAHMNSQGMRHFRMEILNCVADVNEKFGTAKVWVTVRVSGLPVGLFKESVSLLYWRQTDVGWLCWKHLGLCQVSPFPM